jgi:hypothetical protein
MKNVGMPGRTIPGVICFEGMWTSRLTDKSSVLPLLDLLERQQCIRYVHRDIGTIGELEHYVDKWLQKGYANYGLGQFAFHGEPGAISVGRKRMSMEELAALIDGRAAGRTIYFGSCGTLKVPKARWTEFLRATKARAVCGFHADVDWLESAAFEMLLIEAVTHYKRIDASYNWMRKNHGGLCRRLEFKMHWL